MAKRFVVGVEKVNIPPISGFNADGEFVGVLRQIIDSVAEFVGIEIELMPLAQQDMEQALDEGRIDIRFPSNPAWGHVARHHIFTADTISGSGSYYCREGEAEHAGRRLGTLDGYSPTPTPHLSSDVFQTLLYFPGIEELLEALDAGHVSAIFAPDHPVHYVAQQSNKRHGLQQLPWLELKRHGYHFCLGPKASHLRDEIGAWISMNKRALSIWSGQGQLELTTEQKLHLHQSMHTTHVFDHGQREDLHIRNRQYTGAEPPAHFRKRT